MFIRVYMGNLLKNFLEYTFRILSHILIRVYMGNLLKNFLEYTFRVLSHIPIVPKI